ncbi:glycosyltransferase family 2 protein [Blastococcus sp. PRF04-17]|uniref:glycosyltransferase family 2 protein n=1 Tax=Blastococcus sp. PRF04-17 TaxID=2933797 RepID=UPI001FF3C300|nr:glycosyltransferase [Blastococcus sp. PRF04-17]UOY00222.1 glycosyltransferase [Blastococcus sp. PRF04-17]
MAISFIVRTFNSMATLPDCLASIHAQTVPHEIVVVDSGSFDGTVEYARAHADVVLEIAHEEFTYGRALNLGMQAARHAICAPLSSHCVLTSPEHAAIALAIHEDPRVCATNGMLFDPEGHPLTSTYFERRWSGGLGYSHHSATVSRAVWQQEPFNEGLTASEDKDWARRVLRGDRIIAFDRRLFVSSAHRRGQGIRALHARGRREGEADARLRSDLADSPAKASLRAWLHDLPKPRRYPYLAYLVYPKRLVELHGRYLGYRVAAVDVRSRSAEKGEP